MSKRSRLLLDLALLIGLLVANDPERTGLAIHEWLSITLVVPILVHLVINWEWTVQVTKRFFARLLSASRLNLVVDTALFASTVAVMVSGLAVSSVVAGFFGLTSGASPLWIAVHEISATGTIVTLLVHFALHGKWFVQTLSTMFGPRPAGGRTVATGSRTAQNTLAVFGLTALTALAIFVTVGGTGALLGVEGTGTTSIAVASASGTTRTCPRTGCAATTCHAETGQSPYAQSSASGNSAGAAGGSSALSGSSYAAESAGGALVCPETGCSASSCHAETGESPRGD